MTMRGATSYLCILLATLIAVQPGFGQEPAAPATTAPAAAAPAPAIPDIPGPPLTIVILEGRNAINSIPLMRSVAPVVEVRDQNDFPVEGATVVFSLPAQGPAGTFALGGNTFSTRSDGRGQATAPAVVPKTPGRFDITVTATIGNRRGTAVISQTNSMGTYTGAHAPVRPFYERKLVLIGAGVAVAGIVLLVVLHHSNPNVTVTPGTPVFQ